MRDGSQLCADCVTLVTPNCESEPASYEKEPNYLSTLFKQSSVSCDWRVLRHPCFVEQALYPCTLCRMAWSSRLHLVGLVLILFLGGTEGREVDEGLLSETNVDSGLLEGFEVSQA